MTPNSNLSGRNLEPPPEPDELIRLTISLSDPDSAQELLKCLGNTSSNLSFSVDSVSTSGTHPCLLPIDHVSDRQIEIARLAVETGYYESPRETSLSELADEIGVSSSAVSQRLHVLERKLITALVSACCE